MAFIDNQNENELDPNAPQGQGQQPLVGAGSSIAGGSQGAPAAGAGPGGTGAWTNIQSYLNANQGDTGSSQALNRTVGDQFGKERDAFTNGSASYLQGAQDKVNKSKITNEQADQMIGQAGQQYDYGGNQGDQYNQLTSKVRQSLGDKYTGPTDYSYGLSTDTQNYGDELKQGGAFDTLMNHIYSDSSGKPLTPGQFDLQKQLDVSNQGLVNARNDLSSQYDKLVSDREKTVGNTTAALGDLQDQYSKNQTAFHDYLYGQSNAYDAKEAQAEADANAGYNESYKTDKTGRANSDFAAGLSSDPVGYYQSRNMWGSDLTPEQLQNEQNFYNSRQGAPNHGSSDYDYIDHAPNELAQWQVLSNAFHGNTNALNDFYKQQIDKYKNTGDSEKRGFNVLQDFLNTGASKKQEEFRLNDDPLANSIQLHPGQGIRAKI